MSRQEDDLLFGALHGLAQLCWQVVVLLVLAVVIACQLLFSFVFCWFDTAGGQTSGQQPISQDVPRTDRPAHDAAKKSSRRPRAQAKRERKDTGRNPA